MKTLLNLPLASTLTPIIADPPSLPVKASQNAQAISPNPAAEDYVKQELLATGEAVLGMKFSDKNDRVIRGNFVASLFSDPELQTRPFIKIYNAILLEDIDSNGAAIPFNVEFYDCVFTGRINLDGAEVKTFRIDDSTVKGSVRTGRLFAKDDVALYRSTFESEVTLFDANIVNNLFAKQSKFLGATADRDSTYPFELWKIQVGQSTEITDAVIKGKVGADDAKFGADVKFDGAIFEMPASFKNIQVGNWADYQKAHFRDTVTFENGIIERDIEFTGAKFEGHATFDYLGAARFFDFNQTLVNQEFSFQYSTVGWPYFEGAKFNGPVNFEGMETGNDFDLTHAIYKNLEKTSEPFKVHFTKVDGRVLLKGFSAPAGLDLAGNPFGSLSITRREGEPFGKIKLGSTKIDGNPYIENVNVADFSAPDLTVKDSTTFKPLKVARDLNLSNASLSSFIIDQGKFWPLPTETKNGSEPHLNLRGTLYTDINFVDNELVLQEFRDDQSTFLSEMAAASLYSPQAYRTQDKFLTEKGRSGDAANMEYARKERERKDILVPWSPPWLLSWFLWIFSGYGQHPGYALLWSMGIIIIRTIIFWYQGDLFQDKKESPGKLFSYCFLYSFFLFFSFVVLEFAKDGKPQKTETAFKANKQFHKMLGLIITPTAIPAFGGLIK